MAPPNWDDLIKIDRYTYLELLSDGSGYLWCKITNTSIPVSIKISDKLQNLGKEENETTNN